MYELSTNNMRGQRSKGVFSFSSEGAKKKSRTKAPKKDEDDAYTFEQELPKRHRTGADKLSLTRDEERPAGRPSKDEEEDDMAARIRKVAMMIAADEGGEVEESDDEDVDSDAAWESDGSDEERWGGVFRDLEKGKKKKGKGKEVVLKPGKPLNVNLDESEGESDPEVERSPKTAFKSAFPEEEEDEDEDDEEEDEDEDDEDDEEEASEDDDDDEIESEPELPSDLSDDDGDDMADLDEFVTKLTSADKSANAEDEASSSKKRRVLPVVSAPGLSDGGDLALKSKTKVDLSSLISSAPGLNGASALLSASKPSSSVLKSGVLPAPLPTIVQERIEREAAYEQTKDEGQKWSGVMKRIKEAEHLSFPLQASARGGVKSAGELIATFKPENEHESAVAALLASANLTDSGVTAAEDAALQGQDLTPEEIAARRKELRYQRELMFRAEQRSKRVSKIKSKTFRKLARKRANRAAAADGDQGISLEDLERLDPEAAVAEIERLERERARERATLRHGARSGRWARGGDEEDEDHRRAKAEMLDIKERLQRKIHGKGEESSDDESSEESGEEEDIKGRAFDQLGDLDSKDVPQATKGIAGMAFMKKAEERKLKAVRESEKALRDDIEMFGEAGSGSESEDDGVLKLGEGRMVFAGPGAAESAPEPSKPKQQEKPAKASKADRFAPAPTPAVGVLGDINPWLDGSSSGPSRKRNVISTASEAKAVNKLRKATREEDDDDAIEINLEPTPKATTKPAKKQRTTKEQAPKPTADADASDSDSDNELLPASGVKGFTQRQLVSEAFAGDDVVTAFSAEKSAAIEKDAPQEVDTTLPGWGSWGGSGVKRKRPQKRFIKTSNGIAESERKDAGRANVIISERKEKAAQFLVKDLPYPYTSAAQYEASFKTPVGSEWNSRAGFQRGTVPRVVKKPGAIIEPVRRLF